MIAQLTRCEMDMYCHHSHHDNYEIPSSPWLHTHLYGLSQYLLAQDPALYILNVCLHEDQNPRLIMWPEPSMLVDPSTLDLPVTISGASLTELRDLDRESTHIRDMVSLSGETTACCDVMVSGLHRHI